VDPDERQGGSFSVKLVLPEVDPFLDGVAGLTRVGGFLADTHELKRGDVEHLLDGAGVVSSFDNIEGDALADLKDRATGLLEGHWLALAYGVEGVTFLKLLGELLLHFEVAFVGRERVAVGLILGLSGSLFLCEGRGTRLMGLRYFLTCSYSRSLRSLS
jgi:hypothetical protein